MIGRVIRTVFDREKIVINLVRYCNISYNGVTTELSSGKELLSGQIEIIDTRHLQNDDYIDVGFEKRSALEECREDISHVAPYLKPTFNFAAYINKSETLQALLKLGVDLHSLEAKPDVPPFILKLNFENDIKNHIVFLSNLGLKADEIAKTITKNPYILKETLDDIDVRINYLKSKKFDDSMILRIISKNPFWLSFSTRDIDKRLGFFQHTFNLTGDEVRQLAIKRPRLITIRQTDIKINLFVLKEEMGFNMNEIKKILLKTPKIFTVSQKLILPTFEYIHKIMKIPLEIIAEVPQVMTCREFRLKQRHLFLEKLGRLQLDPKKPNYTSILEIVSHSDGEFCTEVAKSSVHTFNAFLKTL